LFQVQGEAEARLARNETYSREALVAMEAKVVWKGRMSFDGSASRNFIVPLGTSSAAGGDDDGFSPMELLLVGLAGCTAMDVISILEKKRQEVTNFEVRVSGERATEHPKVFTNILLEYFVTGHHVDPVAVERSVELSATKYCSAAAMLDKVAKIEHRITVLEAEVQ
jgi:putative redox protein